MGDAHIIEESERIVEKLGETRKIITRTLSDAESSLEFMEKNKVPNKSMKIDGVAKPIKEHLLDIVQASKKKLAVLDNAVNEEELLIAILSQDIEEVSSNPAFEKLCLIVS